MADQAHPPPPRDQAAHKTPAPPRDAPKGGEGADDPYVGLRILDQIEIREPLGVGSMARVYRAFQHGVDRDVAVKILHRDLSDNPDIVARFHREAQVACLLDHPNAVKVLLTSQLPARDKGAGELVLVMECLKGRTLAEVLAEAGGKLSPERATHVLLQMCDVVGEAHRQGVVHRDLKPENVMLVERGDEPDFVKVLDFGLARLASKDASYATRQGAVFGSPRYISPEGAQGMPVTPAADIYSLATLFFQCLAGRTPFEADTPVALLVAHATEEAPLITSMPGCEKLPAPFAEFLQKNLAKNGEDREPDASALGRALARAACAAGLRPDPVGLRLGWVEVHADNPSRDTFSPELRARIEAEGRGTPGMTIVAGLEELPYDPKGGRGGAPIPTLFDVPASAAVKGERGEARRASSSGPTILLESDDPSGRTTPARSSGRASSTVVLDPHDGRPSGPGGRPTSNRGVIPAVVGHSAGLAPAMTPPPPTSPPYFMGPPNDHGPHAYGHHGPPSNPRPPAPHGPPHSQPHGPPHSQPQPHAPQAHAAHHAPPYPNAAPPHAPHHDPTPRPASSLTSTPGASMPTSPSQVPDEPRRRYGVVAAIVGVCFALGGALSYSTVHFGSLRRGENLAAESLLSEVRRAEERGAWLEPPGQNVRELVLRAQREMPGDGRVYDLRRSLSARALDLAQGERGASRRNEALRFAELSRELDPGNQSALALIKSLNESPPEVVVAPSLPPSAPPTLASAPPADRAPAPPPPPDVAPAATPAPGPGSGAPANPAASAGGPQKPAPSGRNAGSTGPRTPPDAAEKPGGRAGAGSGSNPWL
jgi:eukaryotic-like serine/threonine-protein kinase